MNPTSEATSVQLARAEAIGKALAHQGFLTRREPGDKHPGTVAATAHTHSHIHALILTFGGRHGQMVEITAEATTGQFGHAGRRAREVKPSWRMTAYDAPVEAIVAAATAACASTCEPSPLELADWTTEHAAARTTEHHTVFPDVTATPRVKVRATRFTRPDGAVSATFYLPTYTPPCEHCSHHGELGDTGGWDITGPGFTAEATAHTPTAVIHAFTQTMPGNRTTHPATPHPPTTKTRHRAKNLPAAALHGTRLTEAVHS